MVMQNMTVEEFVVYLRETLIPDLVESGRLETAMDFETACRFLKQYTCSMNFIIAMRESDTDSQKLAYLNEWKLKS